MHVDKLELRSAVLEKVYSIPGVDTALFLDQSFREELELREREAAGNGAAGGLMPFVNTGVWEVLTRQEVLVIVVSPETIILSPQEQLVHIVDQKGQIIGEYLPEGSRENVHLRENAYLLSEDFIIYGDVEIQGEPYFCIPSVTFTPLEGMSGLKRMTSASISTVSDDYVRRRLGYENTKHWTHIIGYDL